MNVGAVRLHRAVRTWHGRITGGVATALDAIAKDLASLEEIAAPDALVGMEEQSRISPPSSTVWRSTIPMSSRVR